MQGDDRGALTGGRGDDGATVTPARAASAAAPRVAVAISAYRSDEAVQALLGQIERERWPVELVIVVDSLGTGEIARRGQAGGLGDRFLYVNSPINLGAAGNLHKRIELASGRQMDFVLALNHDAIITRAAVVALIAQTSRATIGALYALRFRQGKQVYDITGTVDFSFRIRGVRTPPEQPLIPVKWSSSNGALYSTAPFRSGRAMPDVTLWHGWEDYAYGLALEKAGYQQYIVTSAQTIDNYEYKRLSAFGQNLTVADKPDWMLYYSVRNQILVNLHRERSIRRLLKVACWVVMMLVHVLAARERSWRKAGALRAYVAGIVDGLRNHGGKWRYPA